ncbi:BppU family phage baseplate upper protein [Listeria seeligeri]|uniref:BppU family phage baseplate upper protein n=1 Tax=Listeria seeligeri TaxID=1640 RepID=UPI0022EBBE64|nr:BppU family phage baseplate upper protein [Listeria seeligeri]
MNFKKYNLELDFVKRKSQNKIIGRVGEIHSMLWKINLSNDEETQAIGDLTPVFYAEISEGVFVRDDGSENNSIKILDNSNGIIEYKPNKRLFAKSGRLKNCYFALEKTAPNNGVTLGPLDQLVERTCTQSFEVIIEKDAMQNNIELESFDPTLNELKRYLEEHLGDSVALANQALEEAQEAQTNMDDLQIQFNNMNMNQFAKKAGDTFTGSIQFDGVATIFQSKFNNAWWYRLTSENNVTYQQSLHPALVTGINGVQGAGYNFKQEYLRLNNVDVETVAGSQLKVDNSSKETLVWSGSSYFLDTHTFSWDAAKVKHGVLLEFSRYAPGTGVLDYGYIQYFFSKEYLVRNNNKATWLNMPGATDGAKKTVRLTPASVSGDAANGQAPSTSYALRTVTIF